MPGEPAGPVLWKNVALLRGVAILAVVVNHSTVASFTLARESGTEITPSGTPVAFWTMMVLRTLTLFCVPAFFFAAGFMIARFPPTPRVAVKSAARILAKYVCWGALGMTAVGVATGEFDLAEAGTRLLTGHPLPTYWFLMVIAEFYLLAPLLLRLASRAPRLAVLIAIAAEVTDWVLFYGGASQAVWAPLAKVAYPLALHLPFFLAGLIVSKHAEVLSPCLSRRRRHCTVFLGVGCILAVAETYLVAPANLKTPSPFPGGGFSAERVSSTLLALATVLWFATRPSRQSSTSDRLRAVGLQSLPILLFTDLFRIALYAALWHLPFDHILPEQISWILLIPLTLPAFIIVCLGGPLLVARAMEEATKGRARLLW